MSIDTTAVINGELYVYVKETDLSRLRFEAEEYQRMRAAQHRASLSAADHSVWQQLSHENEPVQAIKHIRGLIGCGLKEAKDVYDHWRATGKVELP